MSRYRQDLAYINDAGFSDFATGATPGVLAILRREGVRTGLVVDLGCGGGHWAGALGQEGYDVLGVDLSPAQINLARARAPRARFATGSLLSAKIPACDAVTAIGEIVYGTLTRSMALVADGWHMGTHVGALTLTAVAYWFARTRAKDARFSFGTGKVYSLAGFASAIGLGAVALFMVELLQTCVKQPEAHPDLFQFMEDALLQLDAAGALEAANYPLYFALHLAHFFGYRISDDHDGIHSVLDLREGEFVTEPPMHPDWVGGQQAELISQLLKCMHPSDLASVRLNQDMRRQLLRSVLIFYALRNADFRGLRSVPVLQEVLD